MNYDFRIGQGIDIHKLSKYDENTSSNISRSIVLGGLKIPSDYHIVAHSDGDLVFHAIVDAILGALGLPNIGYYFPSSDIKWKGKDSHFFILHTKRIMENEGYSINNLDIVVISETPKIIDYRDDIINSIADVLCIEKHRVNIKGTTSEKMGFIGRKEGIQCNVVILLERRNKKEKECK